jgi:DNA-binding SARP family transcriptional activator/WD40 repeat protein
VLGPLEVRSEDGVLTIRGAKERQLLAALAVAYPHSASVDQLLEQLWDGSPPLSGRKALQVHVVRLRTALEPGRPSGSPGRYIVRRQDGYALVIDRDQLDATAFADLTARGRAVLSAGDPSAASELLGEALELWRGEPFADWPDAPELQAERTRLEGIRTNATEAWWGAELELGRHAEAVPELERLVAEHPLHEGWWYLLALALYRSGRQGDALDAVRRARTALADELGIDPGRQLTDLEQAILTHDPGLEPGRRPPSPDFRTPPREVTGCPYKGLARYEMTDAELFRGRDRLVHTLVTTLVDHSLVVVAGSSGAGKSSVVRAGLLSTLASGSLPGSNHWRPVVVVPGTRPVDALSSLTGVEDPDAPVVLVCDQLEQLWSNETPSAERSAFLDAVLGLLDDDVAARCILVVRGDHVGRLGEHSDMAQRMLGALVVVPPMTETELRQVVEEPAQAAGLAVEPDLTDVVVRDVLGRTGALPLLSTAMAETWVRRRDESLTLAGYLAIGGVTAAVAEAAELVYGSFPDDARDLTRRILLRLAEQDPDGTMRARQMPVAELMLQDSDPDLITQVVETLVSNRLLARDDDRLEVAHEALLTAWPRLAGWLDEDAVGRSVRRHLTPAALEWHTHDRPDDDLYRGARLDAASEWADAQGTALTDVEREFLDAGRAAVQAELTAAQERARRSRRIAVVLAASLVFALVSTAVAVGFQRTAADREAEARVAGTVADANRLAALSSSARALDVSLLLAAAALQTADTPATRDGLLNALVEHRRATGVRQLGEEGLQETALSANGRTLMATQGNGGIVAWRTGSADPPRDIASWWPESLAVSPDGKTLVASASWSRTGVYAYTRDGRLVRAFPLPRLGGYPRDVAFTDSGELLVCFGRIRQRPWGLDAVLAELDVETGAVRQRAIIDRSSARTAYYDAAFSDDGSTLVVYRADERLGGSLNRDRAWRMDVASGQVTRLDTVRRNATRFELAPLPDGTAQLWSDGAITLYDATGRAVQELNVHRSPVRDIVVLPRGRVAVTTGDGGQVELWNISPEDGRWSLGESLVGHSAPVVQAEPSADGRSLLTGSSDGQLVAWDLSADAGLGTAYPALGHRYVSNRLDVVEPGRLVVAPTRPLSSEPRLFGEQPGADTMEVAATFLAPRTGRVVADVEVGETASLFGSSVAVNPDATLVSVTTSFDTTVLDTQTKEVLDRVRVPKTFVSDSSWLPDGSGLVIAAVTVPEKGPFGGALLLVDTETWEVERTIPLPEGEAQVLEWIPDASVLAVGAVTTHSLFLYDDRLRELRTIELDDGGATWDLSFSPDGRLLAAGRADGTLAVIDTSTWRPVDEPTRVHAEAVLDVEWLPDSNTVVTAGKDELVSLYDVDRDLVRSRALPASVHPGDGFTFLLPGPQDEVVVFNEGEPGHAYPVDPAVWLGHACTVAGRDLTQAEWDEYMPDRPYQPVCDLG